MNAHGIIAQDLSSLLRFFGVILSISFNFEWEAVRSAHNTAFALSNWSI